MAKKKKPTKKGRGRKPSDEMVRWLVRTPPELVAWVDEQAEAIGMSRNAYVVAVLRQLKGQQEVADRFVDESGLFDRIEQLIEERVRQEVATPEERVRRTTRGKKP